MYKYILKRLLLLIPVLIAVSFIVFYIVNLAPGDAVDVLLSSNASEADKAALREDMGLNDPIVVQYGRYMIGLLHGDLGTSYSTKKPVFQTYMKRLPETLKLAFAAIIVALIIGVPLGITAAVHQNTWLDSASMGIGLVGVSMPNFWLGLILILFFSVRLKWFPSMGNTAKLSIVLPAITVGARQAALIMRTTRSSMLEVIRQDYLQTARAKGVPEKKVIYVHALKNSLIPILTVMGTQLGATLGGAVITENIFAWPGVGKLIMEAISSRDTPLITSSIILTTMLSSILMLVVDIIYAFVDPRVKARYSK